MTFLGITNSASKRWQLAPCFIPDLGVAFTINKSVGTNKSISNKYKNDSFFRLSVICFHWALIYFIENKNVLTNITVWFEYVKNMSK